MRTWCWMALYCSPRSPASWFMLLGLARNLRIILARFSPPRLPPSRKRSSLRKSGSSDIRLKLHRTLFIGSELPLGKRVKQARLSTTTSHGASDPGRNSIRNFQRDPAPWTDLSLREDRAEDPGRLLCGAPDLRGSPALPQHRHPLRLRRDGRPLQRPALSGPCCGNGLRVRRAPRPAQGHCLDIRRRRASAMKGSRVFGVVLLLIGLLAVPFFKDAISSLLLVGIWGGMVLFVLVFVVGGTIL